MGIICDKPFFLLIGTEKTSTPLCTYVKTKWSYSGSLHRVHLQITVPGTATFAKTAFRSSLQREEPARAAP